MQKFLLTAAALLAITYGQAQAAYQQSFEGNHNQILNQGWRFIALNGTPENNGIYSTSPSIQAIGIIGGSAGMATFNIVNQIPSHIQGLDCVIVSPAISVASASSQVSYTTGSVSIGPNESSHYSLYIITKTEVDDAVNQGNLKNLLNAKMAEDESTLTNESVGTSFHLTDYTGEDVYFVFRLHNSPGNSIFLVDDFTVTGATLGNHEFTKPVLAVYPNPVKDLITVDHKAIEEISFTDLNGRVVSTLTYNIPDTVQIDVSGFSQGIYIMSVKTAYGITTKKVIKS